MKKSIFVAYENISWSESYWIYCFCLHSVLSSRSCPSVFQFPLYVFISRISIVFQVGMLWISFCFVFSIKSCKQIQWLFSNWFSLIFLSSIKLITKSCVLLGYRRRLRFQCHTTRDVRPARPLSSCGCSSSSSSSRKTMLNVDPVPVFGHRSK